MIDNLVKNQVSDGFEKYSQDQGAQIPKNTAISGAESGVLNVRRKKVEGRATQIVDFLRKRHDSNKKPAL